MATWSASSLRGNGKVLVMGVPDGLVKCVAAALSRDQEFPAMLRCIGLEVPALVDAAKLPVETNVDPLRMAQTIFGNGITIVDASYAGDASSAGIYSGADALSAGVAPGNEGVILSTGRAGDFTNDGGLANQLSSTSTNTLGIDGDAQLNGIAGAPTFDGAIFSARFVPLGSILTMQVTFSSEEYMEFVKAGFNDAVGIWVNGEKALLRVGDGDIAIDNINATTNSGLFVDNRDSAFNTEMDGFTVTLTLKAQVNSGQINDIRIGIADAGDAYYDSNLMIAAHSVQTEVVASDDSYVIDPRGSATISLVDNDTDASHTGLFITKINGVPVVAGSHLFLADGTEVVVNGDGTITLVTDGHQFGKAQTFTYEVSNANGITDVGFVQGKVACFAAGVRIHTAQGPIRVEALAVGDRVWTLDHGLQTLRWVGQRSVASRGRFGAVAIPEGQFGDHGALRVSPQHRILMTGWQAELYCGAPEVLVKAIHLVRAGLLRQDHSGAPVTYFHLLFDRHEIICAEGLWTESYLPTGQDPARPPDIPPAPRLARPLADRRAALLLGAACA